MGKDITTIAHPKDLELAVPPIGSDGSGMTLRQVAKGFSDWVTPEWARACNVEYRSGPSGPPVSLIVEGRKIWSRGDLRWPVFVVKDGKAEIAKTANYDQVTSARFAFSAGPWLVRGGQVCNIAGELAACGFSGLMHTSQRERAAIGIRQDGMVVHYATMAATLVQIAEKMKALGCADAINLDGGGSVGVLDGDKLFGYSSRQICCALMFREIEENSPPEIVLPIEGGGKAMKVCIDPGHGGPDPGALGRGCVREADVVLDISLHLGRYLKQAGIDVIFTRTTDVDLAPGNDDKEELQARCDVANNARADLFVSVHADAFTQSSVRGTRCYHYPTSVKGQAAARAIADSIRPMAQVAGASQNMATISSANYYVLKRTAMPAVLIESGFMTNETDLALLCEPGYRDKMGLTIALGILRAQEKGVI